MKTKLLYPTFISFAVFASCWHYPVFTSAKTYEAQQLKDWWMKSEALLENPKVNLPAFILEGRIGSEIYIYRLHKTQGDVALFNRLIKLLEASKAFELDTEKQNSSIRVKIYSGMTSFETVIPEEEAAQNNKLKLFFKILSENTRKRTISELAQDSANNKGS